MGTMTPATSWEHLRLRPTELRIMKVLSDGKSHSVKELLKCLSDELSTENALRMQIYNLRYILSAIGHGIVMESPGQGYVNAYRYVTQLTDTYARTST